MDEYSKKLDELLAEVRQTPDMRARSQLFKVYSNCSKAHVKLSQEAVECRRLRKVTTKYTELETALKEHIHTFEQWVFFAKLAY